MATDHTVPSLSPEEALKLLQDDPRSVLIDVRSNMEYLFVGHAVGAIHVSWIDEPDWKINPHFVTEVRRLLLGGVCEGESHEGVPVVLICRSGQRSLEAGRLLVREGFTNVYNIAGGFEGPLDEHHHRSTVSGWRQSGLPWEQC
jgi:rhodanese-related sulfurtransferase